jgi:hypothetical protein
MQHSEKLGEIAKAIAAAQGELKNVVKDSNNPHFRSKYADLASILDEVRPIYSKHGIAIVQAAFNEGDMIGVETRLIHVSGEWVSGRVSTTLAKRDAQGVGSAITYMRRYGLAGMTLVAQDDDDGEAAVDRSPKGSKAKEKEEARATAKELAADPVSPMALRQALKDDLAKYKGSPGNVSPEAARKLQERIRELHDLDKVMGLEIYGLARQFKVLE